MHKIFILLTLFFILPLSAALITGVSVASYSSQIASPYFRPAYATIDESGLGVNGTHTTAPENYMWLSAYGELAPRIVYDLGGSYVLDSLRVWNYNEANQYLNRGAKNVEILVSTNNVNFTSLANVVFNKAPGVSNADFSQTISLVTQPIRYIKLDIKNNYGDAGYTGLSEIQFYGSVPELSTRILLVLGLIASYFIKKIPQ